jgi:hypothetical protein
VFAGDSSVPSAVVVGMEDFREAIINLTPSVSEEDLAHFQKMRDKL